ncbi:MAG TPA: hypothetical protein VND80_08395 [Steroidobacteraceae bacterium]|nr:hypothetical protein [Steroidobacteraceae bacterium]
MRKLPVGCSQYLLAAVIALGVNAQAADRPAPAAGARIATIRIPGQPLSSFDIGFVDQRGTYAFSDRAHKSLDLIDAASDRFIGRVGGFTGFDRAAGFGRAGPNGVVAVGGHEFWAGNGDSTLKVVDLRSRSIIASIPTGGRKRVDEMTYDGRDHLVIAVNNADEPPFVSFVSTRSRRVVGKLVLARATDGAEQPAWDPATGLVYLSIPVLDHVKANGAVAVIDPRAHRLEKLFPVHACMPAGLAVGPNGHLLVGCSDDAVAAGFAPKSLILAARTGKIVATIHAVGGSDEVWYEPKTHRYYLAASGFPGGPVLGVVDALSDRWLGNLPTGPNAHSVAADPRTGRVFVPIQGGAPSGACRSGCVAVFAP